MLSPLVHIVNLLIPLGVKCNWFCQTPVQLKKKIIPSIFNVSVSCFSKCSQFLWIFHEHHKKPEFSLLLTPYSWETAELCNKNFLPRDSKLNEGNKVKFLYWYLSSFFFFFCIVKKSGIICLIHSIFSAIFYTFDLAAPECIFLYFWLGPLEGGRLIVLGGCNTAAPELHLRSAVAKSPSTLDAFPGSAHPTPLAKINASPPTNSHHSPDDFRHVWFFFLGIYLYFIATLFFIMSWFCLSSFITSALSLLHQLRLFAFVYFLLDFSWVSYVT